MGRKKILSLLIGLFLFVIQAHSQTTYDFTTDATISGGAGGFGIWNTQANITIGGVNYIITSGGNGSLTNSATGGASNSKCLRKDGSGGDTFTLERVDGQPFQFYGIWVSHQSMNSYSSFYTLPPWYTLSTSGSESFSYQDMTAMTAGTAWNNYTSSSINISSGTGGKNVTSVQISFQAILYYSIDNIVVGPAVSTCTAPTISSNPSNRAICSGSNTTFGISATGATAYQWQVDSGSGYSDITNGGVYSNATTSTLTITGATAAMSGYTYRCVAQNGSSSCSTNSSAGTLTVSSISTSTGSQTNVSCNGGTNGSATVTPSGGVSPYSYSWSPSGGTAATASGLSVGTYTVTVTDNIGCTATRSFTITQPTVLSSSISAQTNVSCNGGTNGSATVSVSGGTPAYTYLWAPSGGTAATATGLAAGTYTCTITDANSCTKTQSVTITQPTALVLTASSQTNIACNGAATGAASVNAATGGAGGYTYNWTPGNPTGDGTTSVTGLPAGTWTCTVTDANSCTTTRTFVISQPTVLTSSVSTQTNVSCNGGANGSATVAVSGGTPGYMYSWSPSGGTAATATGLTAGTYTCTITDANSCTKTQSVTITQPTALASSVSSQANVSCNGGSNGSATVAVSGGTPGYIYSWSPSGGTAATATGLAAGTYTCTITDANSCTKTQSVTITQPTALASSVSSQTNVSCNGGSNGSATVSVSGGTPGYVYSWSPSGGTAATATGLVAGTYTCTITDANSCTKTQSVTITQPTVLSVAPSQTNVSCNGGSNGSATVSVSGGTPGYVYSWSPSGGTAATATGLAAGTYTCIVTDANSCTKTQSFTITQPTVLSSSISVQTNVACNGAATGSATVVVSGGTSGYTYSWAPSGGTAATATGLIAGTYTCTITDANSCTKTQTVTITQPTALSYTTTSLAGYDYNTAYSQSISVTGGTGAKTFSVVSGSLPTGFTLSTSGVVSGTSTQIADSNFTVRVTDANSCTADYSYTLKLNQIPITVTATASQSKVYGASDPVLTYTVSPSLQSGDSFTGALSRVAGENVGSYAISQGTLTAGGKYLITYVGSNFAITAKPITVTATAGQTKVYGISDPVFAYTVSPSLVTGDSFTGSLTRVAGSNVGTYAINQGTLSAGTNYTIAYVTNNFTITAKPITVTAAVGQTKVYGTTDPVFTYTVSPSLVTGDSFSGVLSRVAGSNVGAYAITQGTLSAGTNYTITYVTNNFTITAKPITVTATAGQTKVYGTADPVFVYTVSPTLVTGDSFTGALSRVAGTNVGAYSITQGTLSAGSNYTITYVANNFAITAKPITVTATAGQTKVYGTADPVFAYTVSPGLVTGDSFAGALSRVAGESAGTYAITQGTLSAGTNYTTTYSGSTFTITKANQTITWSQTLELGCDGVSTSTLTATSSSGLPVSYGSSNSSIATIASNVLTVHDYGFATITASQVGDNNYNPATSVNLTVVNSQPNLIRKQFEDIIFFDNSSKVFVSYTWYKNGVLVPGATTQYFKEDGALNGVYYAKATRIDGMVVTTCPLTLSPTLEEEYIRIVPNPVKPGSTYELITNVSGSRLQNAHVEVFSLGSVLVQEKKTSVSNVTLTAPIVEGVYIVRMTLSNGKIFTKNLLVRN